VTLTDTAADEDRDIEADSSMTIYVCITCKRADDPEEGMRPGLELARATARAADGSGVTVRQVRCLANCSRACSAAIRRDGAWTYVFGGLEPDRDADALIDGAARVVGLYHEGPQVGFSRTLSDRHTQSYLADVYVLEEQRGRGLGVELVRFSVDEGPFARTKWLLHTADAHDLYRRFGFEEPGERTLERGRRED